MSLPDLAVVLLLDFAPLPSLVAALARTSRVAAAAALAAKEVLQERFRREDETTSQRVADLYVCVRVQRLPNGALHGVERSTCVPYRVGGPCSPSFYAERVWKEGRLVKDAVWETNSWKRNSQQIHELCLSREYDLEPPSPLPLHHPLLQDRPGLGTYGMPCLEREWSDQGVLCRLLLFEEDEEEVSSLMARTGWDMQDTDSLFAAVDQLMY
ncbi:unnamed protein product [Symbiodinium natans]|uniref:Uncharacterized protein n=1 Tax=Symbiodinium natans TaxID=878477 RepID=A0A812L5A2_9DINO|nr:unnamed protein product [Symbiodinium natans]